MCKIASSGSKEPYFHCESCSPRNTADPPSEPDRDPCEICLLPTVMDPLQPPCKRCGLPRFTERPEFQYLVDAACFSIASISSLRTYSDGTVVYGAGRRAEF